MTFRDNLPRMIVRLLKLLRSWLIPRPARTRRERFARDVVAELVCEHSLTVSQAWSLVREFPDVIDCEHRVCDAATAAAALLLCELEEDEPCLLPFTSRPDVTSSRSRFSESSTPNQPAS